MKLYHYVHCPFCVRVRMALGLLGIEYESLVTPYHDEKTPIDLMGVKMLPIFSWSDGDVSNESLDIIARLDEKNILEMERVKQPEFQEVEDLLDKIGKNVHSLCMPYWIWTPEFDNDSRKYFQTKKEVKRGPFNKLIQRKNEFLRPLTVTLHELEEKLTPFYKNDKMTIIDICIASHLWGMYVFPEFQFSAKVHAYLQSVKAQCNFEYHEDFWK
jgi:glutaredoxin 2